VSDAVINASDAELDAGDEPGERPGILSRALLWLARPLAPLAGRAARHRYEVEAARLREEAAAERRKRRRAELVADAERQKADTLAAMHAQIVAMLKAEITLHQLAARQAAER
jgi:hypothetical protein